MQYDAPQFLVPPVRVNPGVSNALGALLLLGVGAGAYVYWTWTKVKGDPKLAALLWAKKELPDVKFTVPEPHSKYVTPVTEEYLDRLDAEYLDRLDAEAGRQGAAIQHRGMVTTADTGGKWPRRHVRLVPGEDHIVTLRGPEGQQMGVIVKGGGEVIFWRD